MLPQKAGDWSSITRVFKHGSCWYDALVKAKKKKQNPHRGSRFEDFLADDGVLKIVTAAAQRRVLAWQLRNQWRGRKIG
jgi:hypothetical protein